MNEPRAYIVVSRATGKKKLVFDDQIFMYREPAVYQLVPLYADPDLVADALRYRWITENCDIDYRGKLPDGFDSSADAIDHAIAQEEENG
jgi:hypothetical protein